MGPAVVKAVSTYIKWALRDVEVDKRLPPTMLVHSYSPDFVEYSAAEEVEGQERVSPDEAAVVRPGDDARGDDARSDDGSGDDDDDDDEEGVSEEAARRFRVSVEQDLEKRVRAMGRTWRDLLRQDNVGEAAPTLYGFAVIQHMILVVSHDANRAKNPVVVLEQISLNDRGLWLWNAMSIAIPINVAKETAHNLFQSLKDKNLFPQAKEAEEEDPDK